MGAKKKQTKDGGRIGVEWELLLWGDDMSYTERLICYGDCKATNPFKDKSHLLSIVKEKSEGDLAELVDQESWDTNDVVNIEFLVIWKAAGKFGVCPVNITMESSPSFVIEPAEEKG